MDSNDDNQDADSEDEEIEVVTYALHTWASLLERLDTAPIPQQPDNLAEDTVEVLAAEVDLKIQINKPTNKASLVSLNSILVPRPANICV